jgi:hypothetical protein
MFVIVTNFTSVTAHNIIVWVGIALSVLRLATDWTIRGSNPGGGEIFRRGTYPASCTMGTGSFPGVKRSGRGADQTPPSSAEVTNEYSYTSTPPLDLRGLL